MKLILVMLSLMIMACGGPTVELERKFEKGEIVVIEGEKEKYVVMYSHQFQNSIIYEIYPINNSNNTLYIKEENISKYINKIEE